MNENNTNETAAEVAEESKPKGSFLYETVSVFVTALVIIAIMFTFLFRFVGVDGSSMVPTLENNDWLIVSAINTDIEQGDIVISTQPNAFDEPIVKRVIAKGGQTVDIVFSTGKVYVDGTELDEPYVAAPTYAQEGNTFPMVVPEGKLFLMGDNRNDSTDSRSPMVGCVDERYILGVVKCRLMPNFTFFGKSDN